MYDSETHLQRVGHGQTHETRVQIPLAGHSEQCSKQHDAVADELDANPKPPARQCFGRVAVKTGVNPEEKWTIALHFDVASPAFSLDMYTGSVRTPTGSY